MAKWKYYEWTDNGLVISDGEGNKKAYPNASIDKANKIVEELKLKEINKNINQKALKKAEEKTNAVYEALFPKKEEIKKEEPEKVIPSELFKPKPKKVQAEKVKPKKKKSKKEKVHEKYMGTQYEQMEDLGIGIFNEEE